MRRPLLSYIRPDSIRVSAGDSVYYYREAGAPSPPYQAPRIGVRFFEVGPVYPLPALEHINVDVDGAKVFEAREPVNGARWFKIDPTPYPEATSEQARAYALALALGLSLSEQCWPGIRNNGVEFKKTLATIAAEFTPEALR